MLCVRVLVGAVCVLCVCIVRTRHVCLCVFVRPRMCPCICFAAPACLRLVAEQLLQQVSSSRRDVARYFAQMATTAAQRHRSRQMAFVKARGGGYGMDAELAAKRR